MTPKLNHPFMEGLKVVPKGRTRELEKIKNWMSSQPHLPEISDQYLYLFLHACYWVHDKTKSAIENYFSVRSNYPAIFGDRDHQSPRMSLIFDDLGYLFRLPKTTPEGYRILLYAVKDNDPTKMIFSDGIKAFCMFNDIILSEDGLQEGYIVVFDMKGVQLGHLARVNLTALRCFMIYIQEAHPCRLKAIHVLNTTSWIHHVMRLIMPLLKSELLGLITFHRGNTPDNFPTELLPIEYGGESATIPELERDTRFLLEKYRHWLIESTEYKSDESKRAKKTSWWGFFNGSNKSSEQMDEKTVLKNLQID